MAETPFPFIVGCERSGTTLLRLMLDAHPALAIPPESYFVIRLHRNRSRIEGPGGAIDRDRLLRELSESEWFRRWELPEAAVHLALQAPTPDGLDFAEAMRRVFGAYAARRGKPRYGDKTPAYVLRIRALAGLFPESRFVHLIRDGRDVALSLAEMPWGPGDRVDSALHWRDRVRRGMAAGRSLGPNRYLELRYERLVAEPAATLRDVAGFLKLEFDQAMLRHHESATPPEGAIHQRSAEPPVPGVRDWRRDMPAGELEAVEAVAGDLLSELGYERAVPDPSPKAMAEARRAVARRGRGRRWHRVKARLGALVPGKR